MSSLSRDAILTVLSGLTLLACDKSANVKAEPLASAAPAGTSAQAAPAAPVGAAASAGVAAKEVPPAQGQPAEKEKSCAPGGCAAGQGGANKKK